MGYLTRGLIDEALAASFVGSQEYFQAVPKGNSSVQTWVVSAYRDLLHRDPAPEEISAWVAVLSGA